MEKKKNPKYLIIDGEIVMGEVQYHKELVDYEDAKVTGGGWYFEDDEKLIFYSASTEFGGVLREDFLKAFELSALPPKYEKVKIYHSMYPSLSMALEKPYLVRDVIAVVLDENLYLWTVPTENGDVKVRVSRGLPLKKDDICMFYNSISKVLGIQNPDEPVERQVVDLESKTRAERGGSWGRMKHAFSVKQLAKVLGSTDESLGVPLIDNEGNFI